MKIDFGTYSYHWHLLPTIKIHFERKLYFGIEIGWINRWMEVEIINRYDKA